MCWAEVAEIGIGLYSSYKSKESQKGGAKKGAKIAQETAMAQLGFAKDTRNLALQLSDPQRQAGYAAIAAMMDMTGLPRTAVEPPDWYSGAGVGDYPAGMGGGDGFPEMPMRKKSRSFSLSGLATGSPTHWKSRKVPAWRKYANDLESYIGAENMPEGIWQGRKGNTSPGKNAGRKRWKSYVEALEPYARDIQGERAATASLPPGVTPPNLGGYESYQWQADPGYQFRVDEGIRAAEAGSGARGSRLSGGALKDLLKYGQNMGSQEYQNIYNRLAVLAGYGSVGIGTGANVATQYGTMGANIMGDLGYNRMSAYTAGANAGSAWWGDVGDAVTNMPWSDMYGWWKDRRGATTTGGGNGGNGGTYSGGWIKG